MTEEIMIDVSGCSHKSDDDCMEVPICNEYGDLMGYQSCEAQTLCPYRSQKKIERLEQENKQMKSVLEEIRDLCIHYENTNDKCVINCYAHFIVTDLIQDKINEVLGDE